MTVFRTATTAALVAAFLSPAQAQSPMACDKRENILRHLDAKYHERPIALGVAGTGGIVEVLTTHTGATWTIIITLPRGPTCLIAAGEDLEVFMTPENPSPQAEGS